MANITISEAKIRKSRGVVVLPIEEYHRILTAPGYYLRKGEQLKGKAAWALDKLVEEGLREYRQRKTRRIRSLADLD